MENCWVFFCDVFGRWQWEHHGDGISILSVSHDSFADADACLRDAVNEGYRPAIDRAIFPPHIEQEAHR